MGIAICLVFIYGIQKNAEANTIDHKFFRQSTYIFFASCLISANDYKKKWRDLQNKDAKIKLAAAEEVK